MIQDLLRPSINSSSKTASLTRQVELEVEIEKVLKGFSCNLAYRTLSNVRKHGIQELSEQSGTYSRHTIYVGGD